MFLNKLLEILSSFWSLFLPFQVIQDYEMGLILFLGKRSRAIGPGLNLKIPLLENCLVDTVVFQTKHCYDQKSTTNDNKTVGFQLICGYTICDIEKYFLCCEEAESVVSDCVMRSAANLANKNTYGYFISDLFDEDILKISNIESKQFGIEIKTLGVVSKFKYDLVVMSGN